MVDKANVILDRQASEAKTEKAVDEMATWYDKI